MWRFREGSLTLWSRAWPFPSYLLTLPLSTSHKGGTLHPNVWLDNSCLTSLPLSRPVPFYGSSALGLSNLMTFAVWPPHPFNLNNLTENSMPTTVCNPPDGKRWKIRGKLVSWPVHLKALDIGSFALSLAALQVFSSSFATTVISEEVTGRFYTGGGSSNIRVEKALRKIFYLIPLKDAVNRI